MKRSIFAFLFILISGTAISQYKVTKNADGNYTTTTTTVKADSIPAKNTGHTITDGKGIVYPVYQSSRGKLYYVRTAKTSGREYKVYIKE